MGYWKDQKSKYKRQRARMHAEDPRCHWCKVVTHLPGEGKQGLHHRYMATIDHLYPKGHPQRLDGNPKMERRRVLSCKGCNNGRPNPWKRPCKVASLEERWRAAGHWPLLAYQSGALPGEV